MKNMTVVDRVVERIKSQPLGDLITEEDLFDIVKEAIPKAFFENRTVDQGGYHGKREIEPAIIEVMREGLKEYVRRAVDEWLIENAEITAEYWKTVLDTNLLSYVQNIQDEKASAHVKSALSNWLLKMNTELQSRGLNPIYL